MIKVCHIISGDLWAGAEVMACHLLQGLKAYPDLELFSIVLNRGRLSEEIERLGIPCYIMDETKLSFLQILLEIRRILKKKPANIIHSHRYKENILAYFASRAKKGIRLITTQHGMPGAEGKRSIKDRLISRLNFFVLSSSFQNVVAVSKDIKNSFIDQFGFSENKVKVIHNGIVITECVPKVGEKNLFIIGSAGRFFPVKDYPLMVEVANEVLKKTNNIRFELAGEGPEKEKIKELIHKYGLEKSFLLTMFLSDASSFYNKLDLYLNTSFHEGIPMSVLEAMVLGIPVVAPNVGGLSEIVTDRVEGYLIADRNPKDFANKCLCLYENKSLRKQMGVAAHQRVAKDFTIHRTAEQYYSLYQDVAME